MRARVGWALLGEGTFNKDFSPCYSKDEKIGSNLWRRSPPNTRSRFPSELRSSIVSVRETISSGWLPAKWFGSFLPESTPRSGIMNSNFACSIKPPNATASGDRGAKPRHRSTEAGPERISTDVAALVDTNVLVYRFDDRFPVKQKVAIEILRLRADAKIVSQIGSNRIVPSRKQFAVGEAE